MNHVGQIIIKLRNDADLTQEEVARKADVSLSYLTKLEVNGGNPSSKTLQKLASVFGLNGSDLLLKMEKKK